LGWWCDTFADIVWPWSVGYFVDLKTMLPHSFPHPDSQQSEPDMTMKFSAAAGAAIFAFTVFLLPAEAGNITEREKRDCRGDYHNYCSEYGLGTNALRACMSRNIKKVSHACVGALVNAGEMTQAQADKLQGKGKTTKKSTHKKTTHKKTTSSKKKH